MKELNLHEEIIKSLKLISYDRSLTLNEQIKKNLVEVGLEDEPLQRSPEEDSRILDNRHKTQALQKREKEFRKQLSKSCSTLINTKFKDPNKELAKTIFLELRKEVGIQKDFDYKKPSTWMEPSAWGTGHNNILNALKKIKNIQVYRNIFPFIYTCYPTHLSQSSTLMQFIQEEEYSKGQFLSKYYAKTNIAQQYQYEFNDKWLEKYESILKKFSSTEMYEKEYDLVSPNLSTQIYGLTLPATVREGLHVVLPLLSFLAISIGGAGLAGFVAQGVIELADAALYVTEGENWMAGLSLFFAICPMGKLMKILPSLRKLMAKGGKKSVLTFLDKMAGKNNMGLTRLEKSIIKELATPLARGEMTFLVISNRLTKIIKSTKPGKIAYGFLKSVFWLIKNGYLFSEFLISFGLTIAGGFWSWGKIAQYLGIATSEELKQITSKDFKDRNLNPQTLDQMDLTNFMLEDFTKILQKNLVFSDALKNTYYLDVLFLQLFLKKSGSDFITPFWENPNSFGSSDKDIVNYTMGGIKQKEGNKIFIFINERPNKKSAIDIKGQEVEINGTPFNGKYKILDFYYKDGKVVGFYINTNYKPKKGIDLSFKNKGKIRVKSKIKGLLGGNSIFDQPKTKYQVKYNWGYYDKSTVESVKTYQKKNNLPTTGFVDPKTLKIIISDLKSKKYGKITNTSGAKLGEKIQNKQYTTNTDIKITPHQVDTVIVNQPQAIRDSLRQNYDSMMVMPNTEVDLFIDTTKTWGG